MTLAANQHKVGPRRYKCDACGKVDAWGDTWGWYGTYMQWDTCPGDLPMACSEECMEVIIEKVESGKFKAPVVQSRGYYCKVTQPRKGY